MSENSKIQWTDHTWSPWYGCTKVSPGCANCYAEALNHRFRGDNWGRGKPRREAADWRKPRRWNSIAGVKAADCKPLLVFPSQCDWLDPEVPVELLAEFLQLIHDTPHLTWQLLTKRPELWRERLHKVGGAFIADESATGTAAWANLHETRAMVRRWIEEDSPPQNVWVGVSVEDQQRADERIPALLDIPAKLRFLSVEPLLGPIGLMHVDEEGECWNNWLSDEWRDGIGWVIIGGESGPGARPCNVEWIRSIKDQCQAADVPVFVKQLGRIPVTENVNLYDFPDNVPFETWGQTCAGARILLNDPKGGDPDEWPADLRVRQMPEEVENE